MVCLRFLEKVEIISWSYCTTLRILFLILPYLKISSSNRRYRFHLRTLLVLRHKFLVDTITFSGESLSSLLKNHEKNMNESNEIYTEPTKYFFLYIIIIKKSADDVDIRLMVLFTSKEKEHYFYDEKKRNTLCFSFFCDSAYNKHREIVQKGVTSLFLKHF